MIYDERQPSAGLGHVIRCFWSLEYDGKDSTSETVLPDGCPEIVFNLADRFQRLHSDGLTETQPRTIFSGQLRSRITIRPTGKVRLFGVRFQPPGAHSLGGLSLNELTDKVIRFDDVLGRDALRIEDSINEARSFAARQSLFESFLIERLNRFGSAVGNFGAIADRIELFGGRENISKLAAYFNMSHRSLERGFLKVVGLSPKAFSRVIRFRNLVRHIENGTVQSLSDSAYSLGFYDQSHMIREFTAFSGKSPTDFIRETHALSNLFTGTA